MIPNSSTLAFDTTARGTKRRVLIAGDCIIPPGDPALRLGPDLEERIRSADLSVVNLEAPITNAPQAIEKSGPLKHSAPTTPRLLSDVGFDAVTLANNHIMDYGRPGLARTVEGCSEAGMSSTGAGNTLSQAFEPLVAECGGNTVSVLNLCEREFGIASDHSPGTAWIGHPSIESRIDSICSDSELVIVIVHGGIEYVPFPPIHLQDRFRSLIDRGVDVVIGHHPHVPQGWEAYHDGAIIYSLGNFLFRQAREQTRWGLTADLVLDEDGSAGIEIVPTILRDGTVVEMEGALRRKHLEHLEQLSSLTQEDLMAHWQAQAVRVFENRYAEWLTKGVGALPRQFLDHPSHVIDTCARWDESADHLVLLNLLRNESHQALIQTALEIKTGNRSDLRTPEVERTVTERLAWTDRTEQNPSLGLWRAMQRLLSRWQ